MPKRPDQETTQTYTWILSHLEVDPNVSLPKQEVYEEYKIFCQMNQFEPLCVADFGKAMKYAFPCIKPRRLGQRGNSRYCYSGLRKKYKLETPNLPSMDIAFGSELQQNPIEMDTSTTTTTITTNNNTTTKIELNAKQLTSIINEDNNISTNDGNNLIVSCDKQANLSACNGHIALRPSDNAASQSPTTLITTGIIPMTSVYNTAAAGPRAILTVPGIAPTTTISSTQYNENNHHQQQYLDANNVNHQQQQQHLQLLQQNQQINQNQHSMNQRESLTTSNNNFELNSIIYNHSTTNNTNTTTNNDNGPNSSANTNTNNDDANSNYNHSTNITQTRSNIFQHQQVPSSAASTSISSPFQPTTVAQSIRHPVVSQVSFDQGTSVVGETNFINQIRPGTPDDDDYCHHYYDQYQYQDNFINNNGVMQQHNRHRTCSENNNNVININYASNFRCQQHFQNNQSQQQQQQYQSNQQNTNNNHNSNNNNIDDNNNQQQYHQHQHQQQHQQHQHHVTTPTGSSVNADPALSNGGAGPGYTNNNRSEPMYKCSTDNASNPYNSYAPKQEPIQDGMSSPFGKQVNHLQQQQQQQQVAINQSAIPLSMFTLDSCVSSPFQSPASTPYPNHSHMMMASTPNPYDTTTNELDTFTTQQESILASGPPSAQNHYMTT